MTEKHKEIYEELLKKYCEKIGDNLREQREKLHKSQEAFSADLNSIGEKEYTRQKISRMECGQHITLENLYVYSICCKTTIEKLLDIEEPTITPDRELQKIYNLLSEEKRKMFIEIGKAILHT